MAIFGDGPYWCSELIPVYEIKGDNITSNVLWRNNGNPNGWIVGDYLFSATLKPSGNVVYTIFPINAYNLYTADIVWQLNEGDNGLSGYVGGFFGGLVDYGNGNTKITFTT